MTPRFNIGDKVIFDDDTEGATWGICFIKEVYRGKEKPYLVCDEASGREVDVSDGSDLVLVGMVVRWDSEAI